MTTHKSLPVHGYRAQSDRAILVVNELKEREERLLRVLDEMAGDEDFHPRWLAIARTHFEQGFMALNRSVFQPDRVKLEGDPPE